MSRKETFKNWLDQIYNTVDGEISCRELQDLLPAYVDVTIHGHNPNGRFTRVPEHLLQCPDCRELYEELLHLAQLEVSGSLLEVDQLMAELTGEKAPAVVEEKEPVPTA